MCSAVELMKWIIGHRYSLRMAFLTPCHSYMVTNSNILFGSCVVEQGVVVVSRGLTYWSRVMCKWLKGRPGKLLQGCDDHLIRGCSRPPAELQFHMLYELQPHCIWWRKARCIASGKNTTKEKEMGDYIRRVDASTAEAVRVQLEIYQRKPILGAQFVRSDSVISICSSSKFISVVSDMDAFCLCVNPFSVGSRNTGVLLFLLFCTCSWSWLLIF